MSTGKGRSGRQTGRKSSGSKSSGSKSSGSKASGSKSSGSKSSGSRSSGGKSSSGKSSGGNPGGMRNVSDGRAPKVRVKTAKGRKLSSTLWLQRQLNDPYVAEARRLGYRGRAAFKLADIDDKYQLLGKGARVVDLGCAPGGWLQIARQRCGAKAHLVGMDILPMEALPDVAFLEGDFMAEDAPDRLRQALDGRADLVLSDMAAPTTGHPQTDHLRIMALAETAYAFAAEVLSKDGAFVAKVFSGGAEKSLLDLLKRDFARVHHFKPPSSRKGSPEMYVIALGFRGSGA